eukprot:gene26935-33586_t
MRPNMTSSTSSSKASLSRGNSIKSSDSGNGGIWMDSSPNLSDVYISAATLNRQQSAKSITQDDISLSGYRSGPLTPRDGSSGPNYPPLHSPSAAASNTVNAVNTTSASNATSANPNYSGWSEAKIKQYFEEKSHSTSDRELFVMLQKNDDSDADNNSKPSDSEHSASEGEGHDSLSGASGGERGPAQPPHAQQQHHLNVKRDLQRGISTASYGSVASNFSTVGQFNRGMSVFADCDTDLMRGASGQSAISDISRGMSAFGGSDGVAEMQRGFSGVSGLSGFSGFSDMSPPRIPHNHHSKHHNIQHNNSSHSHEKAQSPEGGIAYNATGSTVLEQGPNKKEQKAQKAAAAADKSKPTAAGTRWGTVRNAAKGHGTSSQNLTLASDCSVNTEDGGIGLFNIEDLGSMSINGSVAGESTSSGGASVSAGSSSVSRSGGPRASLSSSGSSAEVTPHHRPQLRTRAQKNLQSTESLSTVGDNSKFDLLVSAMHQDSISSSHWTISSGLTMENSISGWISANDSQMIEEQPV